MLQAVYGELDRRYVEVLRPAHEESTQQAIERLYERYGHRPADLSRLTEALLDAIVGPQPRRDRPVRVVPVTAEVISQRRPVWYEAGWEADMMAGVSIAEALDLGLSPSTAVRQAAAKMVDASEVVFRRLFEEFRGALLHRWEFELFAADPR